MISFIRTYICWYREWVRIGVLSGFLLVSQSPSTASCSSVFNFNNFSVINHKPRACFINQLQNYVPDLKLCPISCLYELWMKCMVVNIYGEEGHWQNSCWWNFRNGDELCCNLLSFWVNYSITVCLSTSMLLILDCKKFHEYFRGLNKIWE